MEPMEFKARFIKALPEMPPGIDLRLDKFFIYTVGLVNSLPIPDADKAILKVSGLPKSAAPFLSFGMEPKRCLKRMSAEYGLTDEFDRYRIIGFNSCGDMLCIDEEDGGIVYLNHDNKMQVVYLNAGVRSLANSLCSFGEYMRHHNPHICRTAICELDPRAVEPGNFWASEIENQEIE